jgi:hypothetical protein
LVDVDLANLIDRLANGRHISLHPQRFQGPRARQYQAAKT